MYHKTIKGELTLKDGSLTGKVTITTVPTKDGIYVEIDTKLGMVYNIMNGNGWCDMVTNVTVNAIKLIPAGSKMIPVPKSIYAAVEHIFVSRTDAGCEEIPPTDAICAICPCKDICAWLCSHEAV